MSIAAKVMKFITRIFMYISYLSITIMLVMTVVDVVRRFIFGLAMSGVTEYSQMLLIISMTAMAYALVEGRFIAVGILVERFPKMVNLTIEIIMGILSLAFFILAGVQLLRQIAPSIQFNEAYFMIGAPRWPMYLALGASFCACTLATIVYVYDRIINFKDPREKTVFDENPDLAFMELSKDDLADAGGSE